MRHLRDNSLARPASGICRRAAGYTLTELLVVIFILSVIVVAALPVAKRVMDDARTSESARHINAQAALAKTMAARHNRPVGLWFEYEQPIGETNPNIKQCTQIYLAEVQPPYAGSTLSSRAKVVQNGAQYELQFFDVAGNPDMMVEPGYLASLVDPDDFFYVRFDYRGVWFLFQRVGSQFILQTSMASTLYPPGYNSTTAPAKPFQVLRTPRRVGKPLVMTGGTCIDVQYSGMGPAGTEFTAAANRLIVLFKPDGSIDGLSGFIDPATGFDTPRAATGTLHFLIGKVDKVGAPLDATGGSNLHDPDSFWVSIGRQNGSVTSTDNLPDTSWADWTPAGQVNYLRIARENATTRKQRGGN